MNSMTREVVRKTLTSACELVLVSSIQSLSPESNDTLIETEITKAFALLEEEMLFAFRAALNRVENRLEDGVRKNIIEAALKNPKIAKHVKLQ